jgi:hypothetical protein
MVFELETVPSALIEQIEATDFSKLLQYYRDKNRCQLRVGVSKLQKTPHCYETILFDWDDVGKDIFLSELFGYIHTVYQRYKSPSKTIGLRPQLIHYPKDVGCLGSHYHDNSIQKIGAVCVLQSSYENGAFYVERDKQIYLANERVGDCVVFDFGLVHGVASHSTIPDGFFEKGGSNKIDLHEIGRLVAVLTSE